MNHLTKRKQAEEKLSETREYLENLIKYANGPIIVWDTSLSITRFNRAFENLSGYQKSEVIGKKIDILFPENNIESALEHIQETVSGKRWESVEIKIQRKDGEPRIALWNTAYILDKEKKNIIATIAQGHDITQRKQAEESLRRERQRLHNVLEVMPMMVCLLTPDYHIPFTNRAFREKFGESKGRHCYEYCFGKKEPCDFCESYEVLKTGKPHRWEVTTPDGATVIEAYDFPFTDVDGSSMILEVDVDITQRKQAQKALQEAHDQLENKVAQRTEELQKANLRLQELDQLKTIFIASISHELRTPLSLIIGFTDIILQEISGEINQEQRRQFSLVKKNASHLLDLISDILDINKIEAGKAEMIIEEFDLSALSREVKDNFTVVADKKGLALSLESPPTLSLETDRRRTRQILVNLLSNALKFTDRGEIKIKVIPKDETIDVSVRDSGTGIKKENMDKLFNSFSQIANQGRVEEGTGLGLYLSQKNAHLLGGDITAKSEFGKGSVFTLILPLKYKEIKG